MKGYMLNRIAEELSRTPTWCRKTKMFISAPCKVLRLKGMSPGSHTRWTTEAGCTPT